MPGMSRAILVTGIVLTASAAAPASAAVRVCSVPVVATASAASELAAKKAALDQWKAVAKAIGEGYASWRLAADRALECKAGSGDTFVCVARGSPCTIEQAPNTRGLRKKRLDI